MDNGKLLTMPKQVIAVIIIIGLVIAYKLFAPSSSDSVESITYTAQRGDLRITVLEGGNIKAQESQEIRSEIRSEKGIKILSIVEEGYLVTQEDIDNGLILVELETSALEDKQVRQEIAAESAEAAYTERKLQYDIQLNQNQSNISEAKLNVKFSRMDFEKFLGAKTVNKMFDDLQMERNFPSDPAETKNAPSAPEASVPKETNPLKNQNHPGTSDNNAASNGERGGDRGGDRGGERSGDRGGDRGAERRGGGGFDPERIKKMIEENGGEIPDYIKERLESRGISVEDMLKNLDESTKAPTEIAFTPQITTPALSKEYLDARAAIDFSSFANEDTLEDGEALQNLRRLESDALVAIEDARLAKLRLEGQKRLAEKNFITKSELDLEQVKSKKAQIRVETTKTERELYIKYTFPKEAEQLFSDYEEALMELQRRKKEADAKMAQEYARLTAEERKFTLEKEELLEIIEQIGKCTIHALRPGLVVYGSSTNTSSWRRSSEEPIQEGATLRERQRIITIPDMTHMGVKVDVQESDVQKVTIGQEVTIRIDAFPGRDLKGEIVKVAVLADSANAYLNPDLKVYPTEIAIEGTHDWLRPNMSAQVEILIEALSDVVYIPIQAVTYQGDKQICYVKKRGSVEIREIILGSFTEEFIEIKEGLEEGEEVLMLLPIKDENENNSNNEDEQDKVDSAPAA